MKQHNVVALMHLVIYKDKKTRSQQVCAHQVYRWHVYLQGLQSQERTQGLKVNIEILHLESHP